MYFLHEMSRIGKSIETESRLLFAWNWMGVGSWEVRAEGCRVSFCSNENILNLIVVMGAQLMNTLKAFELYILNVKYIVHESYPN